MSEAALTCSVCAASGNEARIRFMAVTMPGARGISFALSTDRHLVPENRGLVTKHICSRFCGSRLLYETFDDFLALAFTESITAILTTKERP